MTVPGGAVTARSKSRSKSRSRSRAKAKKNTKDTSYKSDGVEDHDVFLLPVSDYGVVAVLTILGAIVRMFRIYNPPSVVFDEVQYV